MVTCKRYTRLLNQLEKTMSPPDPEFKIGDYVTYRHGGFLMRGVVTSVYVEADEYRYLLMEEPEGKPLAKHNQVDTHPAYIMQSKHYIDDKKPTIFNLDKKTGKVTWDW